ncbi:MAG TPA: SDR family oxidoreductase [Jatrophihabitantaceae bacterium]|nr:SDR family oxidoreductase [Jatrophihabitantaceae bacterium]
MSTADDGFSVAGRVVVVTGASKGLGRAFATGLARAGARVVVSSRKQDGCEAVAAEITAAGGDALALAAHVGSWDELPTFVDAVVTHYGRIDGLVNNAGISPAFCSLVDMTEAYWDKVMSTNLKGPLRLSALVAPHLREAGGGSIVNVASIGGYRGHPRNAHYSASKAGLINLTQSMAAEWADWGIRVNSISPGPFRTTLVEGMERSTPGGIDAVAAASLQRRVADPAEAVGLVRFLLSDASSFVTGADHEISGGRVS